MGVLCVLEQVLYICLLRLSLISEKGLLGVGDILAQVEHNFLKFSKTGLGPFADSIGLNRECQINKFGIRLELAQDFEEEVLKVLGGHGLVFAIKGDFEAGENVLQVEVVVGLVLL